MTSYSISSVERETGLSKDILRKWEARYGFPRPVRQANGERFYTGADLARLLASKRLIDQGLRPGHVVPLSLAEMAAVSRGTSPLLPSGAHGELLGQVRIALQSSDSANLTGLLDHAMTINGLDEFVQAIMPDLIEMVGWEWASGGLSIHQEHLFADTISSLLLEAMGRLRPRPGMPRIVFSTAPGERHCLGILMIRTVSALAGAQCISLGVETPAAELVAAAAGHRAEIVALSFSIAFPKRRIAPFLEELRAGMPGKIQIWAGGRGADSLRRKLEGIRIFSSLAAAALALGDLRAPA